MEILAPAKINLCLHVLGRRPDGYHEVAMLMQPVSLYDRLVLEVAEAGRVEVACAGVDLAPGEENIAARAARALLAAAGRTCRVVIRIDKQIPVAAGLGGGSSDAAAVLLALDRELRLGFDRERLMALAAGLGADVPFFIHGGSAWATGIGERLQPVKGLPLLWYVLVNPGIAVSTAWVYGNLGLTSRGGEARIPRFSGTAEGVAALLHNDLEPVTAGRYPVVGEIREQLLALGAAGAMMSGSGPTVFGIFPDEEAARAAAGRLRNGRGWRVFVAHAL